MQYHVTQSLLALVAMGIALTLLSANAAASTRPQWIALTDAFLLRNNTAVDSATQSKVVAIRRYAIVLQDISARNVNKLSDDGRECSTSVPQTAATAAAYFSCILYVSKGYFELGSVKKSYIWRKILLIYYDKYRTLIDDAAHNSDPLGISKWRALPSLQVISKWPDQTVAINKRWDAIGLTNGIGTAYVGRHPVKMRIDTGSPITVLSTHDAATLIASGKLRPLDVTTPVVSDVTMHSGGWYYATRFSFGPVRIRNAYVLVEGDRQSAIGMNELSMLGSFSVRMNGVTHVEVNTHALFCGKMLHSRPWLADYSSYPYIDVRSSVGKLGLIIDSGIFDPTSHGRLDIAVTPVMYKRVLSDVSRSKVAPVQIALRTGRRNATPVSTIVFPLRIQGVPFTAFIGPYDYQDQQIGGAITGTFLERGAVSYNFRESRMCVSL